MREKTETRPDITCPKDGDLIPLDRLSISKWSETLYRVYCPRCNVWHGFVVTETRAALDKQEGE
jgi:hypothetical protein